MVMCKYFLRGTCRFGDSCKNEHAYNAETTTSVMRKKGEVDTSVIIKSVSNDMDKAEKGNQWPLSCYGPFQAKACFPGFEDKCFEEIRLGIYEAEKNGTVEQYKQQLTQLLHEVRMKMRSLQNPTTEASLVLQELYNSIGSEQQISGVFTNTNNFGTSPIQSNSVLTNTGGSAKGIFSNQTAQSFTFALPENKSIFGNTSNTNSIFAPANPQNFVSGGGIFSGNQQQNQSFQASNIFKNANTSIFCGQQGVANQSPFSGGSGQPAQSSSNIFMQNNQPPNPFKQNIQASGQSPFGTTVQQSAFGVPNQSAFGPQPSNITTQSTFTTNQNQFSNNQNPNFPTNQALSTFTQVQPSFGPVTNQSPFIGSCTPTTNQTPFASTPPNQSAFPETQPSPFGANQSQFAAPVNPSPFASSNTSQASYGTNQPVFAQVGVITENRSIFAQAASTEQNSQDHSKSIFGSSQSTIVAPMTRQEDPTIYSKLETLTDNDITSFEANSFEFGKIPDKPPTLQMCS